MAAKTPTTNKPPEGYTLGEARLHATRPNRMPYMAHLLMSMHPIETTQIVVNGEPTFGVDKRGRLYYHPECLKKWNLGECSAVLLHEGLHVMLQHWKRCHNYLGPNPKEDQLFRANIAEDCTINEMLRAAKIKLPGDCCFPEKFDLPPNKSWEEYYELLLAKKIPQTVKVKVRMLGGGSCSDGEKREWEFEAEGEDGAPVELSELEQERIIRTVCKEMQEHETRHGRGSVPGDLLRMANEILNPKVDPWKEFLAAVRWATTATHGFGDYTYKKLPRRTVAGGVRLPAHFRPSPQVLVLVDTSGSMGEKDLGLALGVIRQGTRHVAAECMKVAAADTEIHVVQKVFSAESVKLIGGGGTDMGAAMEEAAKLRPAPDVLILVSDGITPWPAAELRQRCVVLLTQPECEHYPVPKWMKTIQLEVKE